MKISKTIIGKYQEGGAMPPEQAAPAPQEGAPQETPQEGAPQEGGGGEDPLMQLMQMAQQALQGQDCQMMAQVCEGFISLAQQAGGGGGAPQEAPTYKKCGVLVRRGK